MSETVITTPKQPNLIDKYSKTASFLSLEHAARMALSVALPLLAVLGLSVVFSLWTGTSNGSEYLVSMIINNPATQIIASSAVTIATALLVSGGLFWLFDRRVSGEILRRPQYRQRLAYKLPLYLAFGITAAIAFVVSIDLIATVLNSITLIGVVNTNVGELYLSRFLPEVIGLAIVASAGWYQLQLLRGNNKGRIFAPLSLVIAVVLAATLIISATSVLHAPANNGSSPSQPVPLPYPYTPRSNNNVYDY